MRKTSYSIPTALILASALVAVVVLFSSHPAHSAPDAPPVKWEYRSMTVESGSMQAKVTELANESWEIQTLLPNESVLEQAGDAKPHLLVEKYLLIARRPAN